MAEADIIVFDDDPAYGAATLELFEAAGYRARLIPDGTAILAEIEAGRPRLIVLDIMMPGLDGLSACKTLRARPGLKDLRIVLCSSKTVGNPREQAAKVGADLFVAKPYDIADFLGRVRGLIGEPGAAPAREAENAPVEVAILGSRSGPDGICAAVSAGDRLLILDAGRSLQRAAALLSGRKSCDVVLTHYHPGHVEGLGALAGSQAEVSLWGPNDLETSLEEVARKHLPAGSSASLHPFVEGPATLASGLRAAGLYAHHAGAALALRVEVLGKTIVYCPDNEVRPVRPGLVRDIEDKVKAFARGADLLIHDARFTPEDYAAHPNEGHSAYPPVVDLAIDAGVKRLLLFHLDGAYAEDQVKAIEAAARAQAQGQITELEVAAARDGMTLTV